MDNREANVSLQEKYRCLVALFFTLLALLCCLFKLLFLGNTDVNIYFPAAESTCDNGCHSKVWFAVRTIPPEWNIFSVVFIVGSGNIKILSFLKCGLLAR